MSIMMTPAGLGFSPLANPKPKLCLHRMSESVGSVSVCLPRRSSSASDRLIATWFFGSLVMTMMTRLR